jgi:hypothetical protein
MQDIRLASQFFSAGGGALPMNSGGHSWNLDHITTTGNVVFDLLHNFHLECGARLHKLRVYETLTEPTGREVCGYLLVRGSVHAHAYALALQQLTGADVTKILPTPNINLDRIPEARKYTAEGVHRRLYRFSPSDYHEIEAIWVIRFVLHKLRVLRLENCTGRIQWTRTGEGIVYCHKYRETSRSGSRGIIRWSGKSNDRSTDQRIEGLSKGQFATGTINENHP